MEILPPDAAPAHSCDTSSSVPQLCSDLLFYWPCEKLFDGNEVLMKLCGIYCVWNFWLKYYWLSIIILVIHYWESISFEIQYSVCVWLSILFSNQYSIVKYLRLCVASHSFSCRLISCSRPSGNLLLLTEADPIDCPIDGWYFWWERNQAHSILLTPLCVSHSDLVAVERSIPAAYAGWAFILRILCDRVGRFVCSRWRSGISLLRGWRDLWAAGCARIAISGAFSALRLLAYLIIGTASGSLWTLAGRAGVLPRTSLAGRPYELSRQAFRWLFYRLRRVWQLCCIGVARTLVGTAAAYYKRGTRTIYLKAGGGRRGARADGRNPALAHKLCRGE